MSRNSQKIDLSIILLKSKKQNLLYIKSKFILSRFKKKYDSKVFARQVMQPYDLTRKVKGESMIQDKQPREKRY